MVIKKPALFLKLNTLPSSIVREKLFAFPANQTSSQAWARRAALAGRAVGLTDDAIPCVSCPWNSIVCSCARKKVTLVWCGLLLAYGWKLKCSLKCRELPSVSCRHRHARNLRKEFWASVEQKWARQRFFKIINFEFTWLRYLWEVSDFRRAWHLFPYPQAAAILKYLPSHRHAGNPQLARHWGYTSSLVFCFGNKIGYVKASSPGSVAGRITIGFCLPPPVAPRSLLSPSLSYHLHASDLLLCSWPYLQGWLWAGGLAFPPPGVLKQVMLEPMVKHTMP